jgi:6-phosphogluconate dehydrogenase (decarboxylating) (EC 1.1.1.44)
MKIGLVGLGKMGGNMAERLISGKHTIVGYATHKETVDRAAKNGIVGAYSLDELVQELDHPRVIWLMIPSGAPIDNTIGELLPKMEKGDIVVDGGNSNYKETMRRGKTLEDHGIHFVDVGTSGGIWGVNEGYSMMVGGSEEVVEYLRPIFETLAPAPDKGWGHVGPSGAGHFVKMIHNGIEYGLMQSYAEGFALLKRKTEFGIDLKQTAEIWRYGSVVRSWLLDLTALALAKDTELTDIEPFVPDSGEGRWTIFEAIDLDVSAPVITLSLLERLRSRDDEAYADKLLSVMRNQFGGHDVRRTK